MPRNGSGQYALPSGNPVVSNTIISASGWANPTLSDIAAALTDSIAADGQTVPTANLPMGNFRHTQVANAMARTDYASAAQVQDNALNVLTGVAGTGDAITANLIPGIAAYATGAIFEYPITAANTTTTPTLSIDGLPAKTIVFADGGSLTAGALLAGGVAQLYFDGTNFRALSMNTPSKDLARIGSQGGTIAGPVTVNNTLAVTDKVTGSADIEGASFTTAGAVSAGSATISGALAAGSATISGSLEVTSGTNTGSYGADGNSTGPAWGGSANAKAYIDAGLATKQPSGNYEPALGFTPTRQGGGPGQGNSTINIGYGLSNEGVRVAVSGFDQGVIFYQGQFNSTLGSMAVDAIGAYGLFQNNSGTTLGAGNGTGGAAITWSSATNSSSTSPAGNWMCCGYAQNGQVTLFRRVS